MTMYSVEILNPKAIRLLEDLADLDLIKLQPKTPIVPKKPMSDEEQASLREAVLRGSPNMDIDAMLEHLRESRQDRKLPFRDE
ncbi:hypothetical protein ACAW74_17060 [Fibrella sp. WM1]|uniref:hypothetical protein n=1 Tax=Fibrella musci TaxID=3242485 RepID=UPI0035214F3E